MTITQTTTKTSPRPFGTSSMLSKLTGSFTTKQTPQIKQEIELDDPFKHFAPGELVTGAVLLEAIKPIRATHLVVRLHGLVKVVSHSKLPGEPIPYDEHLLNSAKGPKSGKRRGGEYFGNGFARLFEEELVLCGDGRLSGNYEFRFELRLPSTGMPSSIDFENGTITYLLTSILTRPTTISPTVIKECKLKVKEKIDIAPIPLPRPQSISLETVKRRRPVMQMKRKLSTVQSGKDTNVASLDETRESTCSEPLAAVEVPGSPAHSEISSTSITSSSTSNTHAGSTPHTNHEARSTASGSISFTASDKTINAQTEVLQGGCLPGDLLPIKVSIDHTKPVKSMQGVIITFYRLGRIDTHPAIPLGPSCGSKSEDLYPRSRTGLGGLSLSSAGSSRTFRQDLAQNITPLMVDPQTLTAIIKTSVQVPDYIFPTISGVPGSMISFKYFIEIVIDLRGKLGQDRLLQRFSMTETPQHTYGDPRISMVDSKDGVTFSTTPGFNFLVTDQIRRQKGVIHTKTEIVVGTLDSARARGKQKDLSVTDFEQRMGCLSLRSNDQSSSANVDNHRSNTSQRRSQQNVVQNSTSAYIPLSRPEQLGGLQDEKARVRRFEQTLLPNAPPLDPQSSMAAATDASIPFTHNEENFAHRYSLRAPAPAYDGLSPLSRSQDRREICAPTLQQASHFVRSQSNPVNDMSMSPCGIDNEDKQELERQRLQALASSPDDYADEEDPRRTDVLQRSPQMLPRAPTLLEDNTVDALPSPLSEGRRVEHALFNNPNQPNNDLLPDKEEAERLRLLQLVSSPDDDTLPEQETELPGATHFAEPHATIVSDDERNVVHDATIQVFNHEDLPSYRR